MRIIALSILIAGSYYILTKEESKILPEIDSIKLKMAANDRDRAERVLTVDKPKLSIEEAAAKAVVPEETSRGPQGEVSSGAEYGDLEHVEEVQLNDLEEGWNNELKEMLCRIETA
jgi:hypothetical protein